MPIENLVKDKLSSHPQIKKIVKRSYQLVMYTFSKKIKSEGDLIKVSPNDNTYDYFFGYYDKSPWDATGRYMLCMKAKDTSKEVAPHDKLEILLIDTENDNKVSKIAESNSWNVQQGCMAQWLGPDFKSKIIYNDYRDNKYCSVILDIATKEEKVIDMPIYSVASDGTFALTLDFSRLHRLRPGYGYSNIEDATVNENIPNSPCIWKIDLKNNKVEPFLFYKDFYNFEKRKEMENAVHKVNHIMISPNNDKFMVIHRFFVGKKKYSRLVTCEIKSKKLFNLSDDDMVSHCYWKNNDEIIAFLHKKDGGNGYYLMKDKTNEYTHLWQHILADGHPSYSNNKKMVLTDTYPNRKRISTVKLMNEDENIVIARVFAPFKYDNDTRCDLHPRWSLDDKKVCIDSCHEGKRGLYVIPVDKISYTNHSLLGSAITNKNKDKKIKIVYLLTSCKRKGPVEQTLNIIKNLDTNIFYPILITIYDEDKDNRLNEYLPYVNEHYYINTSKKNILLKKTKRLDDIFSKLKPDVIHSLGLFPDFYVANLNKYKKITTLRNYVYEDYLTKFGTIKGFIMSKLHLKAIKKIDKVLTCSKSLSDIYKEKLHLNFDYIQNGVDISKYEIVTKDKKREIREELNILEDDLVYIYTGQFIERKNIPFLLECFQEKYQNSDKVKLLLLGNGPLLKDLKEKYASDKIIFKGEVKNVNYYLSASDVYVSTSKSEGLPNGVLESLATGVPVILSDIPQHKEVIEVNTKAGFIYKQDDKNSLIDAFNKIEKDDLDKLSKEARESAVNYFASFKMSSKYQEEYQKLSRSEVNDEK